MSFTLPEPFVELPVIGDVDDGAHRDHAQRVQRNFDALERVERDAGGGVVSVAGGATLDVSVPAGAKLAVIEFALEGSLPAELRMFPNADATAIYSNIRDGSFQTSAPASAAVAAGGQVNDANGLRLAYAPQGAVGGGQQMTGRAVFMLAVPVVGGRRTCSTQAAITSTIGSGNHVIELQNVAGLFNSNAALTMLRFAVSAGVMTGSVRVTGA